MNGSYEQRKLIEELVEALCQDKLTSKQASQLDEMLRTDVNARRYYIRYLHMHASLPLFIQRESCEKEIAHLRAVIENRGKDAVSQGPREGKVSIYLPMEPISEDTITVESGSPQLGFLGHAMKQCGSMLSDPYRLGGLLVMIVVAYMLGSTMTNSTPSSKPPVVFATPETSAPLVAARYVREVDAVWNSSSPTLSLGDPLEIGKTLNLECGIAEIAFNCGASVLLRGPTRFKLISPMAGILHQGCLSVDVPEEAKGFFIETPQASIVDQGTSFSLNVDKDGNSQAFVHEGEIHVGIETVQTAGRLVKRFFKGEGVRIESNPEGSPIVRDITVPPDIFRPLHLEKIFPDSPQLIPGLRLWLSADRDVFSDIEGKVPAKPGSPVARWIDQSGNSLSPLQRVLDKRPTLVVDDHGRYALRFNGRAQRLEEPSNSGPTSQVLDPSDRGKPQFTMCVVFDTPRNHSQTKQTLFGQFTPTTNDTSRYLGIETQGQIFYDEWPPGLLYLRSANDTVLPNQTYIAVITRNGKSRSAHLNGELVIADDDAECYVGNEPCHWWIGGRRRQSTKSSDEFFMGDISELIIFTRALSDDVRKSLENYLMNKYFISNN